MKHFSLRTLRTLVRSTGNNPLPTAKALRESGIQVVADASVGQEGQLTVYENGFYTYRTELGTTVFAVDRCAGYEYGEGDVLDAELLEDADWTVLLSMKGEDRLERNNNVREKNKQLPCHEGSVDPEELPDAHDFVTDWLGIELVDQMLSCLTEKQQRVVRMYFLQGMTQEEIQRTLKISRGAFLDRMNGALKKIKNSFL